MARTTRSTHKPTTVGTPSTTATPSRSRGTRRTAAVEQSTHPVPMSTSEPGPYQAPTTATNQSTIPQSPTTSANLLPTGGGAIDPALLEQDIGTLWTQIRELRLQVQAVGPQVVPAATAVLAPTVPTAPVAPIVPAVPPLNVPAAGALGLVTPYPFSRFHSAGPESIPKPKGSAGGGKKGFGLRKAMGLDTGEGVKRYNMILSTVRELAHAARLDFRKHYRRASHEDLSNIFASARRIHPYLGVFQNNWATAEALKQFMGNVRRHGKKKGYIVPEAA